MRTRTIALLRLDLETLRNVLEAMAIQPGNAADQIDLALRIVRRAIDAVDGES